MSTEKTIDEKIKEMEKVLETQNFTYNDHWQVPDGRTIVIFHNTSTYKLKSEAIDKIREIEQNAEWSVGLHANENVFCLRIFIRGQE